MNFATKSDPQAEGSSEPEKKAQKSRKQSPEAAVATQSKQTKQQLRFNRFRAEAKFDGRTKYEKPKYAFNYNYKYKHVDTSLPVTTWMYHWFKQTQKNVLEFLLDLTIRRDTNAVMFKTAGFTKRQVGRMLSFANWFGDKAWYVWDATKHGLAHMAHGMKTLFKDGKWVVKHQVKKQQKPFAHNSFNQQQRVRQVKTDFIKFVPFSLFLLIPGGELFLPAWVLIFPNSVPSQFVGEEERAKRCMKLQDQQEDAAEKLMYILPNYLAKTIANPAVPDEDKSRVKLLKTLLKEDKFLPTDLLEYRKLFTRYGQFRMFQTKSLIHMAHFMSIEPVTGLNTINNILRLFKRQIPVDLPIIKIMTQMLVARELNMYFRRLRQEDLMLDLEDIDNYSDEQLTKVCFQRGININQSRGEQLGDLKLWLSISNKRNVPHILMLVIRLHDFHTNRFQVDQDETEAEILRRSKSDAYYIESVRAFEKAFGMDRLEKIISETQAKRQLLMQDPSTHQFIFESGDLQKQIEALDEFKTRHSTIAQRINETYRIGSQMSDYLEKQIILDYHFRGEQDSFEQDYEHLKQKAEKLLGYNTYFDLSPLTGTPLTKEDQPELYAELMRIQKKIASELDGSLAKHNVKISQFEEDLKMNPTPLDETEQVGDVDETAGESEELVDQAPTITASEAAAVASAEIQAGEAAMPTNLKKDATTAAQIEEQDIREAAQKKSMQDKA